MGRHTAALPHRPATTIRAEWRAARYTLLMTRPESLSEFLSRVHGYIDEQLSRGDSTKGLISGLREHGIPEDHARALIAEVVQARRTRAVGARPDTPRRELRWNRICVALVLLGAIAFGFGYTLRLGVSLRDCLAGWTIILAYCVMNFGPPWPDDDDDVD